MFARFVGALAALCVVVPWCSGAEGLPELVVPDSLGVNIHFTDPRPGEMEMLAAAGFHWVRMDFSWQGTELKPGQYDFSRYDHLMAALAPHKIRAVFILDYSNPLYDHGLSPASEEGRQAFARWAVAAAGHFRGKGVLWEMYNEPNISFWKPAPDVQQYIKLALAVGKALREAEPGEMYIGPATSQIDLPFLEECFKAGLLEYWCAVSVHPYRQCDPEAVTPEYAKLRELIARYAPKDKKIPILSGEWGYSAAWDKFDETRQAKYLARQWLTNLANEVPLSIWYDWHDDGQDAKEPEHHFGTVLNPYFSGRAPVYDAKPAYKAAKTLCEQLAGFRFSKRFCLGADHVVLFEKGDKVRVVAFRNYKEPGPVKIPASPGQFSVVDYLGNDLPKAAANANGYGLIIELADSPQYFTPDKPNDFLRVLSAWQRAPLQFSEPAKKEAVLELSLKNPLDHPIRVAYSVDQGEQSTAEVKPGETVPLDYRFALSRLCFRQDWPPRCMRLSMDGVTTEQFQTMFARASDAIDAEIGPVSGKVAYVRLENPSGEPLDASVDFSCHLPIKLQAPAAYVKFARGDRTRDVRCELPEEPPRSREFSVELHDRADPQGRLLGSLSFPPQTTLADFAKLGEASLAREWAIVADGDPNVNSTQSITTAAAPPGGPWDNGKKVLRVVYQFRKGWKFVRLVPTNEAVEGYPFRLAMWVFGDGSGNTLRMRFRDATGQTFQPRGVRMTWKDWQYVEFLLFGHEMDHWGGANDGEVHNPIRIDTLLLIDGNRKDDQPHEIYVCGPALDGSFPLRPSEGPLLDGGMLDYGATAQVGAPTPRGVQLQPGTELQFASVQDGRQFLSTPDEYTRGLSPFDRAVRMHTEKPVSDQEMLDYFAQHVREWDKEEKAHIEEVVGTVRDKLAALHLRLPETITLIKTSGKEEGNAAYCRGNAIVFPESVTHTMQAKLFVHELFHIYSRNHPELRPALYGIVGFTPCPPVELPAALRDIKISNPDAPAMDYAIWVNQGGQRMRAVPVLFSKWPKYDPKWGDNLFGYLSFRLMALTPKENRWVALTDEKGQPLLRTVNEVDDYWTQIGRNTGYNIHPEEILAENFALLVLQNGRTDGVATPRVLEELKRVLLGEGEKGRETRGNGVKP
jgi:hypothetical protein